MKYIWNWHRFRAYFTPYRCKYRSVTVQSEIYYLELKKEISLVEAVCNNLSWNFLLIEYTLLMKLSVVFWLQKNQKSLASWAREKD